LPFPGIKTPRAGKNIEQKMKIKGKTKKSEEKLS
jgi:hypothetical protein